MLKYLTILLITPGLIWADYGSYPVTRIHSVYDGDTVRVDLASLPPVVGENIPILLRGIDTPEIKGRCAQEKTLAIVARDRLRQLLQKATIIEARNITRGRYFRIVADLILDNINVADVLLAENLAVKYSGGKKAHSWCH